MIDTATLAALRFGYGLPRANMGGPKAILTTLAGPDLMAQLHPTFGFALTA